MIEQINLENAKDINTANQPFEVIGVIVPEFSRGKWTYSEVLYEKPYEKRYHFEDIAYDQYIDNPHQTIFFYYDNGQCTGQIRVKKYWNKYAFIQDLTVSGKSRGQGVGTRLIKKAKEWALQKKSLRINA